MLFLAPCELLTYECVILKRQICGYGITMPTVFSTLFYLERGYNCMLSSTEARQDGAFSTKKGFFFSRILDNMFKLCIILLVVWSTNHTEWDYTLITVSVH